MLLHYLARYLVDGVGQGFKHSHNFKMMRFVFHKLQMSLRRLSNYQIKAKRKIRSTFQRQILVLRLARNKLESAYVIIPR